MLGLTTLAIVGQDFGGNSGGLGARAVKANLEFDCGAELDDGRQRYAGMGVGDADV